MAKTANTKPTQPGKPGYANLGAVRHSLCFYGGLIATDQPDLHNLDTDRDKNTVFEIDTQNEVAMVDEAIEQWNESLGALEALVNAIKVEFNRDSQMLFYSMTGRQRLFEIMTNALDLRRPHIHRGGGRDADECGLCGHDLRHSIHSRTF